MIVRALSPTGDWTFGRGKSDYLARSAAVAQNIQTRLKSFLNDCFFDAAAGIDWLNLLGSKNETGLTLAINTVIVNTDYVTRVEQLSVNLTTDRSFAISYSVTTAFTGVAAPTGTIQAEVSYLLTEDGFVLDTEQGDPINV
jgi:hypothetical protein